MSIRRDRNGSLFLVRPKGPDGFKTGAFKKENRVAFETVRKRDKNDPTKYESRINARFRDMTTSASETKSQASSTKSSGPAVETERLAVIIYLASRQFKSSTIQEFIQQRLCELLDLDIFDKFQSVTIEAKLRGEKGEWDLDRVNEWLNKQLPYDNRMLLTEINALIGRVLGSAIAASVGSMLSSHLYNPRDNGEGKSARNNDEIPRPKITQPQRESGKTLDSTSSGLKDTQSIRLVTIAPSQDTRESSCGGDLGCEGC